MNNISQINAHNDAYRLLMDLYIVDPTEEQIKELGELFKEWCKSAKPSVLNHLIEVIETHESPRISLLAKETIRENFPKSKINLLVNAWITNPVPSLRAYIEELVEIISLQKPILTATLLMLDKWEKVLEIDPNFNHIDTYLQDLDPLLGSLLFERVNHLKSIDPNFGDFNINELERSNLQSLSIIDLLRRKEFDYLWENILNYPFPFICQLLKIFNENEWMPNDQSEIEIFEILLELIGQKGWKGIEQIKWETISLQENGKFRPLTKTEIREREFELQLSDDIVFRPDRISDSDFQNRGHFNLTDAQLDLFIYDEGIRKSDFDGLLHVPIYSRNGYELAEFAIPAASLNSFQMDEDGTYFTVRSKKILYSVDVDALASILLPVSKHSEMVSEIIPTLKEKSSGKAKMGIDALNLISALHIGREYNLWDLKNTKEWGEEPNSEKTIGCGCILTIDFGNTKTKLNILPGANCGHEEQNWLQPSIVFYDSPSQYLVGQDALQNQIEMTSQTFINWKQGFQRGKRRFIRIHNAVISYSQTLHHFLREIIRKIKLEISYQLDNVSVAYSLDMPSYFQLWLNSILLDEGFKSIDFVDSPSAAIIAATKIHSERGNMLLLDIGSSQMTAIVAKADFPKSRKRKLQSKINENPLGVPQILAKMTVPIGTNEINSCIASLLIENDSSISYQEVEAIKQRLSYEFEVNYEKNGDIFRLTLNPTTSNADQFQLNVRDKFYESDLFRAFKLILKNIIVKSTYRGLRKNKINRIIITGEGAQWPIFLEHINETFQKKSIVMDNDPFLVAKGAGLVSRGNIYEFFTELDYTLKITNKGVVSFRTLLPRGINFLDKKKSYQIQPQARFDQIVIDWWVRKPKFFNDDQLPLKDNERIEFRRDDDQFFDFDRMYREVIEYGQEDEFEVQVSKFGKISFSLLSEDGKKDFQTNIRII